MLCLPLQLRNYSFKMAIQVKILQCFILHAVRQVQKFGCLQPKITRRYSVKSDTHKGYTFFNYLATSGYGTQLRVQICGVWELIYGKAAQMVE